MSLWPIIPSLKQNGRFRLRRTGKQVISSHPLSTLMSVYLSTQTHRYGLEAVLSAPPAPRCQSARDACLSPASKTHCTSQEWLKLRFSNKIFSLTVFRTPKCLSQLVSLYFRTLDLLSGRNRVLHPVETGHLLRSVRPWHAPACNSGTLALLKEVQTPWLT